MNEQINNIVDTAVNSISKVAEVNTIVGKPLVTLDGTTVLPISQVTFAFVAGGGEYGNKVKHNDNIGNFAGGSGGGATLTPVAFLVVNKDGVKLMEIDGESNLDKIIDVAQNIASTFKS